MHPEAMAAERRRLYHTFGGLLLGDLVTVPIVLAAGYVARYGVEGVLRLDAWSEYWRTLEGGWPDSVDPLAVTLALVAIVVTMFLATSLGRGTVGEWEIQERVRRQALDGLTRWFAVASAIVIQLSAAGMMLGSGKGRWLGFFMVAVSLLPLALAAMCAISSAFWERQIEREQRSLAVLSSRLMVGLQHLGVSSVTNGLMRSARLKELAWLGGGHAAIFALSIWWWAAQISASISWQPVLVGTILFAALGSAFGVWILTQLVHAPIEWVRSPSDAWPVPLLSLLVSLLWVLFAGALWFSEGDISLRWLGLISAWFFAYPWLGVVLWRRLNWWKVLRAAFLSSQRDDCLEAITRYGIYREASAVGFGTRAIPPGSQVAHDRTTWPYFVVAGVAAILLHRSQRRHSAK